MNKTILLVINILYCLVILLISCGQNPKTEEINNPIKQTVLDSSTQYADDPIDDSTMAFLDSLPSSEISTYSIALSKTISVATYSNFLILKNSDSSFYKNGKISSNYIDSVKGIHGMSNIHLIELYSMINAASYFENTSLNQQKLDALIVNLINSAIYLTTKENFIKPTEGNDKPKQTGLSYLWGGKDATKRYFPSLYKGKTDSAERQYCPSQIYGLDCSGFLAALFNAAGIKMIPGKAENQRKVKYLQAVLTPYFGADNFEVSDMGHLDNMQVKNGDIIYRLRNDGVATHIGIILKDLNGRLYFAESHGSPTDCKGNLEKGPTMSLLKRINGSNYKVLRITLK